MAFTLNAGEFDLGAGYIGRGTVLGGEAYAVGTSTTGVQGLLNTAGLESLSVTVEGVFSGVVYTLSDIVFFRSSDDPLTGAITATTSESLGAWSFVYNQSTYNLSPEARIFLAPYAARTDSVAEDVIFSVLNSRNNASTSYVQAPVYSTNQPWKPLFRTSTNWRFLARDHQTALVHYPSTAEEGAVFAASCINSSTQWGLWIGGEVGERSGYFNRIQGVFAIVFLVNGATTYFSAFSPSAADSATRNDSPLRNFNIIPAAGQSTTNDKICELLLLRDQGSNYSAVLGKVPGFFYIDPNKAGFDSYAVGDVLDIDPLPTATFEGRDRAIIAGRWGLDASLSVSNVGALFTVGGSPNRRTLENGVRLRFTATPPTGTATGTDYWVVNWNETAFTFNLSTVEGGSALTPSSNTTSTVIRKAALVAMRCY